VTDKPISSIQDRALRWFAAGHTGLSSEAIAGFMLWGEKKKDIPWDSSDFERCVRLLNEIPEWRERLPEMAEFIPAWSGLVEQWSELERLCASNNRQALNDLIARITVKAKRDMGWVSFGKGLSICVGGSDE
jgi:hypothetical protein